MENQGFYYISYGGGTFYYGHITDINGNTVCPGEIIPATNIDSETLEDYIYDIGYYAPVLPGEKIRLFWDELAQIFNISTKTEVYTDYKLADVNFDLLDRGKCYYATIQEKKTILTYITDVKSPTLCVPDLTEDLAFENHREVLRCSNPTEVCRVTTGKTHFFRYSGEIIEI
jgi:hypothetical protein